MRWTILIVLSFSLLYLDSCKEVVGPVPEFQYEFSDFDEVGLTPFDTTTIQVGDVAIVEGGVTNPAFDALTSESPANLMNTSSIYDGAISGTQRTFWEGEDQSSVLAAISSGDATITSQLASLETSFSGNATLSTYLPSVTQPSVSGRRGREINANNSAPTAPIAPPSAVEDELDDCRQAAQDAFDEVVTELDAQRTEELNKIALRFQNQSQVLVADAAAERLAASDRNDARLALFLTTYNDIVAYVNGLVTAGDISAGEGDNILLLALNVYAFSISASYEVFQGEVDLINQVEVDLLADLTAQRVAADNTVEDDYNSELAQANAILASSQGGCHNQGAGSGS